MERRECYTNAELKEINRAKLEEEVFVVKQDMNDFVSNVKELKGMLHNSDTKNLSVESATKLKKTLQMGRGMYDYASAIGGELMRRKLHKLTDNLICECREMLLALTVLTLIIDVYSDIGLDIYSV